MIPAQGESRRASLLRWTLAQLARVALPLVAAAGCAHGPTLVRNAPAIDRKWIETPSGFEIQLYAVNLTAPDAMVFDDDGGIIIAESGIDGREPAIYRLGRDGRRTDIYPMGHTQIPEALRGGFQMYGPIGGMALDHQHNRLFVSHRDARDMGMISAIDLKTLKVRTVVADLPTQGEGSVTDLAIDARKGRLYFGVAAATNSGVVGPDDIQMGWVRKHIGFCDRPAINLTLLGYRFDLKPNPFATLFEGNDIAVTGPFQAFNVSYFEFIRRVFDKRSTSSVFSCEPDGGDLQMVAHGIRCPAGLGFNEYGRLYITNRGMELRGTRPVMNDPDVIYRLVPGSWYGFGNYSSNLIPISDPRFAPPANLIDPSGYQRLAPIIDEASSKLERPSNQLLAGEFLPLSGVSKFAVGPASGPFNRFHGDAIVALMGDRGPFATSGRKLSLLGGYKVARVNLDSREVEDFVRNTSGLPQSRQGRGAIGLERPVDVKFGPDGAMYILDLGQINIRGAKVEAVTHSGRIWRVFPTPAAPTTRP